MTRQAKRGGDPMTKDDVHHGDDDTNNSNSDTAAHHALPFERATPLVLSQRKIYRVPQQQLPPPQQRRPEATLPATADADAHALETTAPPTATTTQPTTAVSQNKNDRTTSSNPFANVSLTGEPTKSANPFATVTLVADGPAARSTEIVERKVTATNEFVLSTGSRDNDNSSKASLPNNETSRAVADHQTEATKNEENEEEQPKETATTTTTSDSTESAPSKPAVVFGAAAPAFTGFATATTGGGGAGFFGGSTSSGGFGSHAGGGLFFGTGAAALQGSDISAPPPLAFGNFGNSGGGGKSLVFAATTTASTGFGGLQALSKTSASSLSTTTAAISTATAAPFAFAAKTVEIASGNNAAVEAEVDVARRAAVVALPENYDVTSGEEDEVCLLELRGKTWRRGPAASVVTTTAGKAAHAPLEPTNPSVPPSHGYAPPPSASLAAPTAANGETAGDDGGTIASGEASALLSPPPPAVPEMQWHEVGRGPLRVLRHTTRGADGSSSSSSSTRLVQRRESTPGGNATLVIVNARLPDHLAAVVSSPSELHVQVVTVTGRNRSGDDDNNDSLQPETYLFKFKLASEAAQLKRCLDEIIVEQLRRRQEQLQEDEVE